MNAWMRPFSKIKPLKELVPVVSRLRRSGKKIVFTNGCFDLLHAGHVRYLKRAKSLGDILVVGLNSDASVRRLKGPGRPVQPARDRAEVLGALEAVDYLVFFSGPTPEPIIRALHPDFLVKGGDWKKNRIAGSDFISGYGGRTLSLEYVKGRSSTRLLEKIKRL